MIIMALGALKLGTRLWDPKHQPRSTVPASITHENMAEHRVSVRLQDPSTPYGGSLKIEAAEISSNQNAP